MGSLRFKHRASLSHDHRRSLLAGLRLPEYSTFLSEWVLLLTWEMVRPRIVGAIALPFDGISTNLKLSRSRGFTWLFDVWCHSREYQCMLAIIRYLYESVFINLVDLEVLTTTEI